VMRFFWPRGFGRSGDSGQKDTSSSRLRISTIRNPDLPNNCKKSRHLVQVTLNLLAGSNKEAPCPTIGKLIFFCAELGHWPWSASSWPFFILPVAAWIKPAIALTRIRVASSPM